MANPVLAPIDGSSLQNETIIRLKYTVGGSGVLTAVGNTAGSFTVARNSAGNYTFTSAKGTYPGGIYSYVSSILGTYTTAGGTVGIITADSTATSTPTFTFIAYAVGTQTATEIDSGVTLLLTVVLKNGTV